MTRRRKSGFSRRLEWSGQRRCSSHQVDDCEQYFSSVSSRRGDEKNHHRRENCQHHRSRLPWGYEVRWLWVNTVMTWVRGGRCCSTFHLFVLYCDSSSFGRVKLFQALRAQGAHTYRLRMKHVKLIRIIPNVGRSRFTPYTAIGGVVSPGGNWVGRPDVSSGCGT